MTTKSFRSYDPHQTLLLPPDLQEWLPEDHLARFVAETVGQLDLSTIFGSYHDGRGLAAYHPQMMVSLLLYGYCTGVRSSRRLARATWEDLPTRWVATNQHPDRDTIAAFRRRHLTALKDLFVQVVRLCRELQLASLGHVAIDGSKVKAHASKHKVVSYGRVDERIGKAEARVQALLTEAEAIDQAEETNGNDDDQDDLPKELQRAQDRLAALKKAKEALEQRARDKAEAELADKQLLIAEKQRAIAAGERDARGGSFKLPDPEQAAPDDGDQYCFTDPESRIMKDGATKGFIQAYNVQVAVDSDHGLIVAADVGNNSSDVVHLPGTVESLISNTGAPPTALSADAGYFSKDIFTHDTLASIDCYIPPRGRPEKEWAADAGQQQSPPNDDTKPTDRMRAKLAQPEAKDIYRMRKAIVEPIFGIAKERLGVRQFLLRGIAKVQAEWAFTCLAMNVRRLHRIQMTTS